MNEPSASAPATSQPEDKERGRLAPVPFFGRTAAIRLGAALLAGFVVIAASAFFDRTRRTPLETFEEVTAVGDRAFFRNPEAITKPPPAAATLNGQPLYPVSYKKIELRDTKMFRVGQDAETGVRIYATRESVTPQSGESERKNEQFYFLKVAPNAFIKVRAWTPGM